MSGHDDQQQATSPQMQTRTGLSCRPHFSSYEELYDRALRASSGLSELGVGAGDRIAVLLRNSIEYVEASVAIAAIGASKVPINWHWQGEEVAYVLEDSAARALVVHAELWPAIASHVPERVRVILVPRARSQENGRASGQERDGIVWWPEWLAAHERWASVPEGGESIIYTSGTTGRPKGVVRAEASDQARDQARALLSELFQLAPGERTVIPAPMYHSAPNVYVSGAVMHGMHVAIMDGFDPEEFLRIVEAEGITVVQMVPTMFVRLLALPEQVRSRYDISSLRWVVHAAAPCPPEVKRAMIDWWGPIIAEYYGSTESGPVTFCTSEEALAHPGTVGRALAQARVRILDADGRTVPVGEPGEVFVRLDVIADFTYEGDPAKRRAAERDGLISCGDIGCLDDEGYLYLKDRASDMVISGGVNIYPAEIEACLLSLGGVRDCAVFGIPDDELGETLAVHVELDDGAQLDAGDVRAHVRAHLARYKTPRVVEFASSLPREDSGKIFKRRLREPYWAGRGRTI